MEIKNGKQQKGFAVMKPEQVRKIAAIGGRNSQESGRAHRFTADEAREAGRKGGIKVSADRDHMAKIGRKGGKSRIAKKHNRFVNGEVW